VIILDNRSGQITDWLIIKTREEGGVSEFGFKN
jgi:hypothetical protein